jgi:Leucine-rich repeat (LRR) protein
MAEMSPDQRETPPDPVPRRMWYVRYLRFRLSTFLIAIALIAAWPAFYYSPQKRAERATKSLRDSGLKVHFDYQRSSERGYSYKKEPPGPTYLRAVVGEGFFQNAEWIQVRGKRLTTSELLPLAELPGLRMLTLPKCEIGDEHLRTMRGLRQLKVLDLADNQITDAGLEHLAEMVDLNTIQLCNNPIQGPGLANLRKFSKLKMLVLMDTPLTDEGAAEIGKLESLEILNVSRTQITDAGLKHFEQLHHLQSLDILGTKATREGLEALRQAMPGCGISF